MTYCVMFNIPALPSHDILLIDKNYSRLISGTVTHMKARLTFQRLMDSECANYLLALLGHLINSNCNVITLHVKIKFKRSPSNS